MGYRSKFMQQKYKNETKQWGKIVNENFGSDTVRDIMKAPPPLHFEEEKPKELIGVPRPFSAVHKAPSGERAWVSDMIDYPDIHEYSPTQNISRDIFASHDKDIKRGILRQQLEQADKELEALGKVQGSSGHDPSLLQRNKQRQKELETKRGGIEAQLNQMEALIWGDEQRKAILEAGDKDLLDDIMKYAKMRREQKTHAIASKGGSLYGDEFYDLQNRLRGQYPDQLETWAAYADRIQTAADFDDKMRERREFASKHPFGASAISVPTQVVSGVGYLDAAQQALYNKINGVDAPINYKSPAMLPGASVEAMRGQVAKNIEKGTEGWIGSDTFLGNLYGNAYQLAMSMADSAAVLGLAASGMPGSELPFFGSAAYSGMQSAKDRGATDTEALAAGYLAGYAEVFFEHVSLENLLNMDVDRGLIKNMLVQGGVELSEEGLTAIANTLTDKLAMGGRSEFQANIRAAMDQEGMDYEAARKTAEQEWVSGFINDLVGGFVSGGAFAGIGTSISKTSQAIQNRIMGQYAQSLDPMAELQRAAAQMYGATDNDVGSKTEASGKDTNVPASDQLASERKATAEENPVVRTEENKADTARSEQPQSGKPRTGTDILENYSKSFGQAGKDALRDFYTEGQDMPSYYAGFSAFYEAGLSGDKITNVRTPFYNQMTNAQQVAAYAAGRADAQASLQSEQQASKSVRVTKGKLIRNEYTKGLKDEEIRQLDRLASATGANIEIVPHLVNDANGLYNKRTGSILISADADSPVVTVAAHEVTHRMQALSPKEYRSFRNYAINHFRSTHGDFHVPDLIRRYAEDGVKLTHEEAMDEVAAEFVEAMVKDEALFEEFARKDKKSAKTVLETIKQFIRDVKDKLRGKQRDRVTKEKYGMDLESLEEAVAKWNDALKAATSAVEARQGKPAATVSNKEKVQGNGVQFSLKKPVEETKNLIAVHNLTLQNLIDALKLGGLPSPSIAIVKADAGHAKYGPISILFRKNVIDPKANKANKVYGSDAYTPTAPPVEYEANSKVEAKISNLFYELQQKYGRDFAQPLYALGQDLEGTLNRNRGVDGIISNFENDQNMMNIYLEDSGIGKVDDVIVRKVDRLEDAEIKKFDFIIEKMGEDVINDYRKRPGENPREARSRWWDEHGDEFRGVYGEFIQTLGISADVAAKMLEHTSLMKMTSEVLGARNYLANGPEKVTETTDSEAKTREIKSRTNHDKYMKWLSDLLDGAVVKKGIYNGKSRYTDLGNRRSFSQTHYEYTLENIVKAMNSNQEERGGQTMGVGANTLQSVTTPSYKSIEEIKRDSSRLGKADAEKYAQLVDDLNQKLRETTTEIFNSTSRLFSNSFEEMDHIGSTMIDAAKGSQTVSSIMKTFQAYGRPIEREMADKIRRLYKESASLPTEYFEAKPRRAVTFDEAAAVVMPDGMAPDVQDQLKNAGVNVLTYEEGNEADRLAVMNSVDDVRFSVKNRMDTADARKAEALQRENDSLRQKIEYWKGQTKISTAPKTKPDAVAKAARDLRKQIGTDADVTADLQTLYDGIASGKLTGEEAYAQAADIAMELVENAVDRDDSMYQDYAELRKQMRDTRILISEADAENFPDFKDFKKSQRGHLRIAKGDTTNVDTVYKELAEQYPEFFDEQETTHPADQLQQIADVLDSIYEIKEYNPYDRYMDQAITGTANEILETFFDIPEVHTYADRIEQKMVQQRLKDDARLAKEKTRSQEKLEKQRASARETVRNTRTADDMYYGRKMAEADHTNKERIAQVRADAEAALTEEKAAGRQSVADARLAGDMYYGRKMAEAERAGREKLNQARAEARSAAEAQKAESDQALEDARLADQMYYGGKLAAQKRTGAEKLAVAKQEGREAVEAARTADDMYYGRKMAEQQRKAGDQLEAQRQKTRDTQVADEMFYGRKLQELRNRNRKATADAIAKEKNRRTEDINRLKETYRAKDAVGRDRRSARELRAKIERHAKRLSTKLLNGTDAQHIPQDFRLIVARALDAINLGSNYSIDPETGKRIEPGKGDSTKRTEAFRNLREEYAKILKEGEIVEDPSLLGDAAEQIKGSLEQIEDFGDKPLGSLSKEQLQMVWDTVTSLEHMISNYGKLVSHMKYETTAAWADELRDETAKKKPLPNILKSRISLDLEQPYTFFYHYGKAGKAIWKMLNRAQYKQKRMGEDLGKAVAKIIDPKDAQTLDETVYEFTVSSGDKLILTASQMMDLYNLSKREQARDHLMKGGITQPQIDVKKHKDTKRYKIEKGTDSIKIDLGNLEEILDKLDEVTLSNGKKAKQVADELQELTTTMLAGWGNEASMDVFGYKKFNDVDYWPIHSAAAGIHYNAEKDSGNVRSIKNIGLAKPTVPHAANALDLYSVFTNFSRHAGEMMDYAAWLAPMEDLNHMYNFAYRDGAGVKTGKFVKGIIEKWGGAGANKYWQNLQNDIQNGLKSRDDTLVWKYVNKVISGAKGAAVGFNVSVMIKQAFSWPRAAMVMNPKYMIEGLTGGVVKGNGWKKAVEHSGIALQKKMGGFDIAGNLDRDAFGRQTKVEKLNELAGAGAEAMDAFTWGNLWNACEHQVAAENKELTPGSDEFFDKVAEEFENMIDQTQVVDGILQRSQIMRSDNPFNKAATAYMGEPIMSHNMVLRAALDVYQATTKEDKQAANKRLARALTIDLLGSNLTMAIVSAMIGAFRDDDDDKFKERFLTALTGVTGDEKNAMEKWRNILLEGELVGNLNPLGRIPYIKDILSLAQGFDITRADADVVKDIINACSGALNATISENPKKQAWYAYTELMHVVSKAFGISIGNLRRDIIGAIHTIAVETDNIPLLYGLNKAVYPIGSSANKQRYMDLLYRAYKTDQDSYRKIMQELLKSGYSAADLTKAMERRLMKDKGVSSTSDLDQRFMLPEQQKVYDSLTSGFEGSKVWKRANDEQKKYAEGIAYGIATGSASGEESLKSYEPYDKIGMTETEYILYQAALKVADKQPKGESGHGSINAEEREDAINMVPGLTRAEKAKLWELVRKTDNPFK